MRKVNKGVNNTAAGYFQSLLLHSSTSRKGWRAYRNSIEFPKRVNGWHKRREHELNRREEREKRERIKFLKANDEQGYLQVSTGILGRRMGAVSHLSLFPTAPPAWFYPKILVLKSPRPPPPLQMVKDSKNKRITYLIAETEARFPHARQTAVLRMTPPPTERRVRHCGEHTATPESASCRRVLLTRIQCCLISVALDGPPLAPSCPESPHFPGTLQTRECLGCLGPPKHVGVHPRLARAGYGAHSARVFDSAPPFFVLFCVRLAAVLPR